MGLFDIMDEIAARQVTKSETGDNRMIGVALGIVTANYADKAPGQMQGGSVWRSRCGMTGPMNLSGPGWRWRQAADAGGIISCRKWEIRYY